MNTLIFKYAIIIHVICGFISLLSGTLAMSVKKGKKTHNLSGRFFYWAMLGVFITTVIFFLIYPDKIRYQFFLCIGIVSFYPNWSGKRVLSMKKGLKITWLDKLAAIIIGISGLVMLGYGIMLIKGNGFGVFQMLFLIFGILSLFNAYGDIRLYFGYAEPQKMHWFFAHGGKMTGAYAAAVTAFCVNILPRYLPENLPSLIQLSTWILPGVIIGYSGSKMLKRYKSRFRIA